jgi:pyridoxamine 5'-phosphate oxidase family protein
VLSTILFSKPEIDYMKSQRLARIATVNSKGQPDVVPVGFEFDGTYFWIGSHDQDIFFRTRKYHNVKNGNRLVSLVIDDLESITPWHPRCVKVDGIAEVYDHNGRFGPGKYLRITPKISWSMGIEGLPLGKNEWRLKTIHSS